MSTGKPNHPFYNFPLEQRQHVLDAAHLRTIKRLFSTIELIKNAPVVQKNTSLWYGLCRKVIDFVRKMIKCKGRFTNGSMQ